MGDSSFSVDPGTTTAFDTRTEATNGNHRSVVVIGDPSVNAGVAPVDATNGLACDNKTLPPGASTSAKQPALGVAGTASSDVITIQGIAAMTKLLVTPDSVALPANQSCNVAQLAGTTTDTNSGTKSAGTLRVVLATDQPALTNKLLVTPDANSAVNIAQMNGVTVTMGAGATGTGVQRVVQANDTGRTLASKGGSAASSGDNTLVVAGTNKLKVYAFSLSTTSATAVTCIFQSGASGTEIWRVVLQAATSTNTGANLAVSPPASLFATASATLLNLNLSGAQTVHWAVSYFDEA